ncbi:hypothetical protein [Haloferula sargassicola]|uniref:ABC transporter permease n=1 Tax=Haloferula sargassicola TaxID=490096 RepID=A0ABP9URF6_9BACT
MNIFTAFFLREIRSALLNRFVYLFAVLCLVVGLVPVLMSAAAETTAAYTLLQACLWMVPLFSLLTGVGSAQGEDEERDYLASLPLGGGVRVLGKFTALATILAVATVLLIVPALLAGAPGDQMLGFWLHAFGAGAVFAALGMAVGFTVRDRLKSHLLGLCLWLALLTGPDLLALGAARDGLADEHPDLWLGLLLSNPLDALRISVVLRLDRIPFEPDSAFARLWLGHLGAAFALVCTVWAAVSLSWGGSRLASRPY